jgi:hypothetical protein
MKTLGSLTDTGEFEQRRRPTVIIIVVACVLIDAIILAVYFYFYREMPRPLDAQGQGPAASTPSRSTEVQIFEDEPLLKDSQAVVGGKVRNISRESLSNLSLEIELKRRSGGNTETRTIKVEPNELAPGAEGRYSLTLPRQEFSGTQIKNLRSASRSDLIVFKTSPGARRPKEPPNEQPTRTVIIERPAPRSKDDEFINTPDNPTRVP